MGVDFRFHYLKNIREVTNLFTKPFHALLNAPSDLYNFTTTYFSNQSRLIHENETLKLNIDSLKGKVQIIAYLAKSVPESYKSKSILDLEAMAILPELHSLQRYISNTKCYLLSDRRVLYYLFCQKVGDSSTKIKRWVLKILSDYPLVTLHFVRTTANLADYLTCQWLPPGDLEKLNLKNIEIKDFHHLLPKPEFTLQEWAKFCSDHPEYLTVNTPTINYITQVLEETVDHITQHGVTQSCPPLSVYSNMAIDNVRDIVRPLDILKEKLSRENIIKQQKIELKDIYMKTFASENFEYFDKENGQKFQLILDLLPIHFENDFKVYVPPSLVGPPAFLCTFNGTPGSG